MSTPLPSISPELARIAAGKMLTDGLTQMMPGLAFDTTLVKG